jgi:tellurite methyltransferase
MTEQSCAENHTWNRFYAVTKGNPPSETLLKALSLFAPDSTPGQAIDLGCGAGRDTFELLGRGWRVLAMDQEQQAIDLIVRNVLPEYRPMLQTQVSSFEQFTFPPADLINASFSLPFCAPGSFDAVWDRLVAALASGGRFCGQLFGNRDSWAGNPDRTFHTLERVQELLRPFELEFFQEVEEDGTTACMGEKHWHYYSTVGRKR